MKHWIPEALRVPPALDEQFRPAAVTPRSALLINPFYPKDPHASFGKHVLTPSLALTSIAASTPANWDVRYWDENLLLGPPPRHPFPQVVGITVHLTFAERAYALARWYRERVRRSYLAGCTSSRVRKRPRLMPTQSLLAKGCSFGAAFSRTLSMASYRKSIGGAIKSLIATTPRPVATSCRGEVF